MGWPSPTCRVLVLRAASSRAFPSPAVGPAINAVASVTDELSLSNTSAFTVNVAPNQAPVVEILGPTLFPVGVSTLVSRARS